MKRYIVAILLILPTLLFASIKDEVEDEIDKINMNKMTEDAKRTINSGYDNYTGAKGSDNVNESRGLLDGFAGDGKGALSEKLSSLIGDNDMKTLNGKKIFNGRFICSGNTELGTATYSRDINRRLTVRLNLGSYGNKVISNISSLCSAGFQSRTGITNNGYSFSFTEGKLNVIPNKQLTECQAIDIVGYEVAEKDYDFITAQMIQFLASSGFDAVSGAEKVELVDGSINVKFNSQKSEVCGSTASSGSNDNYGYTPTANLYKPNLDGSVNIPDGSEALLKSMNDDNSIYALMNKSLDIEYKDGAKIGGLDSPKCSIKNDIIESNDYTTTGGCIINPNTACIKSEYQATGNAKCFKDNHHYTYTEGSDMSGSYSDVCGKFMIDIRSSNENKIFKVIINGVDRGSTSKYMKIEGSVSEPILNYSIVSMDNISSEFYVEFFTEFKKSDEFSVVKLDTCLEKKGCGVLSEKICNIKGDNCVQTIKNLKTVSPAPLITEKKMLNGVEYKIKANGNAFLLEDNIGRVRSIKADDAFFLIERELSCPSKSVEGLKYEEGYLDKILGGVGSGDYEDLKGDECATQFCIVDIVTESRDVLNNETGETRVDIGNSKSLISEARTCTYQSDKYVCPYNVNMKESMKPQNDCSCDTDRLLGNIGKTLAGLEVLRQISDKNAQKCGKK